MKKFNIWSWIILAIGFVYFFLPLISTFEFSLKMIKDQYTFEAYRVASPIGHSSSILVTPSFGHY